MVVRLPTAVHGNELPPPLPPPPRVLCCQALLSAPNPDDPLANDVAEMWKTNEAQALMTGVLCGRCRRFFFVSGVCQPLQDGTLVAENKNAWNLCAAQH